VFHYHQPVMVVEVIQYLVTDPNGVYVDATVGGGGHAKAILDKVAQQGVLVGIDRDREAIDAARQVLAVFGSRVKLVQGSFSTIAEILHQEKIETIHGVLFDLGVSSRQLDAPERGFSFSQDGPLDMRMDQSPRAAFLIFTSGKVVCTGAKNVEDVRTVITNMAQTLKSIGFENIDLEPEIHVQNIVASADLKTDLNLNAIALGLGLENIEYEPEQFPGLVYRIKAPKVVVLIFSSGKLVVTGGKSPEECEEGVKIVREQLENMGLL